LYHRRDPLPIRIRYLPPAVWKRVLAAAAFGAVVLGVWSLGLHEEEGRDALRQAVTDAGPWGPVLFVALFAALEAVGVPGLIFIGVAIVVWPPWEAFLWLWLGAVGAGCIGFGFARTIGRRWVVTHLPERFRRFDARLATSGLRYVVAVRVVFFLATPAHWLLGLSGVRFRTALLGTAIGFLPGTAFWAFAGGGVFEWAGAQPAHTWVALAAAAALIVAARAFWRRRRGAAPVVGHGAPDDAAV
jgi:uncharacterized membrane protein YdjX (TVP38/TMEM64 family)